MFQVRTVGYDTPDIEDLMFYKTPPWDGGEVDCNQFRAMKNSRERVGGVRMIKSFGKLVNVIVVIVP